MVADVGFASTVDRAIGVKVFGPNADGSSVQGEEQAQGWPAGVYEGRGQWLSVLVRRIAVLPRGFPSIVRALSRASELPFAGGRSCC